MYSTISFSAVFHSSGDCQPKGLAGRQENELTIAVMLGFAPNGQYASHQTGTGRASISGQNLVFCYCC